LTAFGHFKILLERIPY